MVEVAEEVIAVIFQRCTIFQSCQRVLRSWERIYLLNYAVEYCEIMLIRW